jgi:drug/metabolite transporter (DMT)-like permease
MRPMTAASPAIKARWQLFGSGASFGLMAALARLGSRGAAGFTGPQMATVRFAVGTALVAVLFQARPGTFRPVRHRLLVTRGVLGGLAAFLYFVSLARIPAAQATLLNNTFPVLATLISVRALGERPPLSLLGALGLVALGVVLVLRPSGSFPVGIGALAAAAGAVVAGFSATSIRALRATDNAPTIFFAFSVGGLLVSLPLSFGHWPSDPALWGIAFATALISAAGQLLMTAAYGALTVAEAALWQQLTPVAAYLWALAILDEHLSLTGALGILLGAAGVACGTIFGGRGAPSHPPADARARECAAWPDPP